LPLLPVTLLGVAADLSLRPALDLHLAQWAWWLFSVVFSLVMWQTLFVLSTRLRPQLQGALVYGAGLLAAVLAMSSIGFHQVFYCWPTAYALMHILREPREALGYIRGGADPLHAVVMVAAAIFIIGWWRFGLRGAHSRYRRGYCLTLVALLSAGTVAFGAVHRHASAMVPDAAVVKVALDLTLNSLIGGVRGRLMQARRPVSTEVYGSGPVPASAPNLIVVIGESVATRRTGLYGYSRQTTPRLVALQESRTADWVQFTRAVSNASATKVALPSMLTGLFPSREPLEQHTFPLLWHYADAAAYQTALISSQSYAWNNLEGFFIDAALDHVFTLEHSGAEIVNSEGMDDRQMLEEALRTIDRFAAQGPFVVVIQFNCTHFPGYSPPEWKRWPETDQAGGARYDNSIAYMDHLLGRLFDHLAVRDLTANTSVIFAADHGEDIEGVHQLHRTDSYYQTTIEIPFFIVVPERHRERLGLRFDQLRQNANSRVALSDLVPTALDILGLSSDLRVGAWLQQLDGRPLTRPLEADRLLVVVNTDEHVQWSRKGYAVIADNWKFINYSWRGSMLYDLASDALEQRNLLDESEAILSPEGKRHIARVQALVAETRSLADIHTE